MPAEKQLGRFVLGRVFKAEMPFRFQQIKSILEFGWTDASKGIRCQQTAGKVCGKVSPKGFVNASRKAIRMICSRVSSQSRNVISISADKSMAQTLFLCRSWMGRLELRNQVPVNGEEGLREGKPEEFVNASRKARMMICSRAKYFVAEARCRSQQINRWSESIFFLELEWMGRPKQRDRKLARSKEGSSPGKIKAFAKSSRKASKDNSFPGEHCKPKCLWRRIQQINR